MTRRCSVKRSRRPAQHRESRSQPPHVSNRCSRPRGPHRIRAAPRRVDDRAHRAHRATDDARRSPGQAGFLRCSDRIRAHQLADAPAHLQRAPERARWDQRVSWSWRTGAGASFAPTPRRRQALQVRIGGSAGQIAANTIAVPAITSASIARLLAAVDASISRRAVSNISSHVVARTNNATVMYGVGPIHSATTAEKLSATKT